MFKRHFKSLQVDRTQAHDAGTLRSKQNSMFQMTQIDAAKTNTRKLYLQKEYGLRSSPNPLMELSLDMYQ